MLAYHATVTDSGFDGRFGLLQPMTLGDRAHLEMLIRGKKPARAAADRARQQANLRQSFKGSAPDSALNFWLTPDA